MYVTVLVLKSLQKIDQLLEYDIDSTLTEERWNEIARESGYNYTVLTSNGQIKELFPGGKDVYITINDKKKYIQMVIEYRKNEVVHQTEAIGMFVELSSDCTQHVVWRLKFHVIY